jgi:hypothetical protein
VEPAILKAVLSCSRTGDEMVWKVLA